MARLPRICPPGIPKHIIQRGNNRQACFGSEEDFAAYAHWMHDFSNKHHVDIHTWGFMTNHVHLLVSPSTNEGVSRMMQEVGRHYVRYFNHTYRRTSTLWGGRFKSCVVDAENYLLSCQRYIELNQARANMVDKPADYLWSSYHSNGLGNPSTLWTPHEIYLSLGKLASERLTAYRQLFKSLIDEATLKTICDSVNKGLAFVNDRFKREIEHLTGRRVTPGKRVPKKRDKQKDEGQQEFLL